MPLASLRFIRRFRTVRSSGQTYQSSWRALMVISISKIREAGTHEPAFLTRRPKCREHKVHSPSSIFNCGKQRSAGERRVVCSTPNGCGDIFVNVSERLEVSLGMAGGKAGRGNCGRRLLEAASA